MSRKKIAFLIIGIVIINVVTGIYIYKNIVSDEEKHNISESQLSIGVMPSVDYLPLAIAQKQGFFTKNDVGVSLQKFYSQQERDMSLQSKNIDGAIIDYTGGIIEHQGDTDLNVIFTSACNGTFKLTVGKNSDIHSTADLRGKSFAVSTNTIIDFCVDTILQKAGLSNQEYSKVEINRIPLRLEMLNANKVDATVLPDPFATIAMIKGNRSIVSMKELGIELTGIVFTQEAIKTKAESIKRFYKAYNEGVEYINAHTPEEMKDVLIEMVGFPDFLIDSVKLPHYNVAQLPQRADIENAQRWLIDKGVIENATSYEEITNGQFVKK